MAGSIVRLSSTTADDPTGLVGAKPFAMERTIMSVESATTLTVDSTFTDTLSGVKYLISDPVDVDEGAMLTAFLRCCEKQVAISRNMKTKADSTQLYLEALIQGREADSRSYQTRASGLGGHYLQRLANMPVGADQGT